MSTTAARGLSSIADAVPSQLFKAMATSQTRTAAIKRHSPRARSAQPSTIKSTGAFRLTHPKLFEREGRNEPLAVDDARWMGIGRFLVSYQGLPKDAARQTREATGHPMKPPRKAPSLRVQLAVAFGALTLALAAFLSLALGAMLSKQIEREQGDELRTVSKNAARVLADDLRKNARSARILGASPSLWKDGLDSPAVKAVLARVQAVNPDNSWIGVADESGIVRAATGGLLVGESVASRPWFAPGLLGVYVGDVHEAKLLAKKLPASADGEPRRFVDFSAPIYLQGKRLGALGIHGTFEWVDEVVGKLAPENARELEIETFVFDRWGRMVYARPGQLRGFLEMGQTMPAELGASSAAPVPWRDGVPYLTASFHVPAIESIDLGWTVVTRQPARIAFAAARQSERAAFAIGAGAAALAVVLAWTLASRLSKPLASIAKAARLVAAGSADAIPAQRGSREVAELSGSLGDMTAKLLAANRDLERRVAERTAALTAANEELSRVARRDPLTELLNRRGFEEQAAYAASAARRSNAPASVVVVDADHFKRVNDAFGHAAGDETLKALAGAMRSALRESDFVARIGGEEFAALLPNCDGAGALLAAEKICAAMRSLSIPGVGVVTVSCGAAELAMPEADLAEGLARADVALYAAKREGRDRAILRCGSDSRDAPGGHLGRPAAGCDEAAAALRVFARTSA